MKELIGQTLNRYQIVALLGEGGMGAVFKGKDLTLQRDVAVKVMHPHFARKPDFRNRFLQEARTAARMDHPGIVHVFDFGQHQEILYIIMEFIEGDNLNSMLQGMKRAGQWVRLDEAVQLVEHIASALDYAHGQGVLHRDIKPANIMLKPEKGSSLPYRPVITDLGLARLLDGARITVEGASMGTPTYMSPEQALGRTTDARSDVYSLGILLYEMVVGKPPFPIKNMSDAVRFHTQVPPPPPRSLRPEIPADLERAILFALEKSPGKRLANAAALAQALSMIGPSLNNLTTAAPTQIEDVPISRAVSLMTQYDQGIEAARGQSILQEFGAPSTFSEDRIQIIGPDKSTQSLQMKGNELSIGRGDNNDLTLPSTQASRNHAKITYDGKTYQIIDLNSTNGTFLGSTRLLPGVAETWSPDQPLRIGDYWLQLVIAKPAGLAQIPTAEHSPPAGSFPGTFGGSQVRSSAGQGRIGIVVEESNLQVEPGQSAALSILLLNQGTVVDHFQTHVEGIPETWVKTPAPVQLMPGAQQHIRITIQPPREPESKAGRRSLTIQVTSRDTPGEQAQAKSALTVSPFYRHTGEIHPQQVRTRKRAQITIKNAGNTREVYTIRLRDRADELDFEPPEIELQVPPGGSANAEFQPRQRKRYWFGTNKTHPFSTEISTSQGATQNLTGEAVSRPIIPVWVIPVMLLLCIVTFSGAGLLYGQYNQQSAMATQDYAATQTEIARLAAQVDTDGDGLTDQQEIALGTIVNSADSDSDGLNDKEEVNGVSDPLNPDTDGDGLNDGGEKIWGTNPNIPDSDGDTLSDGVEVNVMGTSPINVDTDGDGLNDNVDPDPGQLPTLTPTLTQTPVPTGTTEPTATLTPSPTIPPDGVSLNCDGTYQRLTISDGGILGKTITVDKLVGNNWTPAFAINSGDPNEKQFEDETGLYSLGGCEQLLAVPVRFTGSGAVLQLVIYEWNGSTMEQVYMESGTGGAWEIIDESVKITRSVYLYGEPNCCPCNRETVFHRWTGEEFVEDGVSLEPTYEGDPPEQCTSPPILIVTLILPPPIIIITPLPISP